MAAAASLVGVITGAEKNSLIPVGVQHCVGGVEAVLRLLIGGLDAVDLGVDLAVTPAPLCQKPANTHTHTHSLKQTLPLVSLSPHLVSLLLLQSLDLRFECVEVRLNAVLGHLSSVQLGLQFVVAVSLHAKPPAKEIIVLHEPTAHTQ